MRGLSRDTTREKLDLDEVALALAERPGIHILKQDDYPKVVNLNVGGKQFLTTMHTLRSRPDSKLAEMFFGILPVYVDTNRTFIIDRDGEGFHHILNFLRDCSVPIGLSHLMRRVFPCVAGAFYEPFC